MQAGPQNQPRRGADGRRCWGEHWEEHAIIFGTGQPKKKEKQKAQKKGKAVQNFCCDLAGQMRFSLPWAPKSWDKGRSFKCVLAKKKNLLSFQNSLAPHRGGFRFRRVDRMRAQPQRGRQGAIKRAWVRGPPPRTKLWAGRGGDGSPGGDVPEQTVANAPPEGFMMAPRYLCLRPSLEANAEDDPWGGTEIIIVERRSGQGPRYLRPPTS